MADKLSVYNHVASIVQESRLLNLTENRALRLECDAAWDNCVRKVLEAANWGFATRTIAIEASSDIDPEFGFQFVFEKPSDWLRTAAISADPDFYTPLEHYTDEGGLWSSHFEKIYVKMISSLDTHGFNLGLWPQYFADAVAYDIAHRICGPIQTSATSREQIARDKRRSLVRAIQSDGAAKAVKRPPAGRWTRSRMGANSGRDGR